MEPRCCQGYTDDSINSLTQSVGSRKHALPKPRTPDSLGLKAVFLSMVGLLEFIMDSAIQKVNGPHRWLPGCLCVKAGLPREGTVLSVITIRSVCFRLGGSGVPCSGPALADSDNQVRQENAL